MIVRDLKTTVATGLLQNQAQLVKDTPEDLAQERANEEAARLQKIREEAKAAEAQLAQAEAAKNAGDPKNIDSALTTVRQGFDRIFCPKSIGSFLHAFPQIVGGGFQTVGSLIDGFFHSGGDYLHRLVDGIPVLENIVQPFADLFNGVGSTIESLFYGVGNAFDSVGGAIESLCEGDLGGFFGGLGDAASDVIDGVTDAVGSAVDAVGDAIGDLFSGW